MRDGSVELKRRSSEDAPVNRAWVTRTRLIAQGLAAEPYIHLDIRTPFGENVGEGQVDGALGESLGPRKDRFSRKGWHLQFVEDTNLGSNHRVFVDLMDPQDGAEPLPGMDAALPLEVAVEALAEMVVARKSEPNFQFLISGPQRCYSVLYANGSPFHVLRVDEGAGEKAAGRLARHRDFAVSQGKPGPFRTFLCPGDPLAACDAVARLSPEIIDFDLRLPDPGKPPASEPVNGNGSRRSGDTALYMHLGLALAAARRDYQEHNRVGEIERLRNQGVRGRARFALAMLGTLAVCLLVTGGFFAATRVIQGRSAELGAQAAAYRGQVDAIRELRAERARLLDSLSGLKPLWNGPVPWSEVMADISGALPQQAGIDGLQVDRESDGSLKVSFRAWVKDWDAVRGIEKRLTASRHLDKVTISEQRKDLASGAVIFHVTGMLEGR